MWKKPSPESLPFPPAVRLLSSQFVRTCCSRRLAPKVNPMNLILSPVFLVSLAICWNFAHALPAVQEPVAAPPPAVETKAVEVTGELLGAFRMRGIGPALMSGRIGDLAVDPQHPNTWYVAVGSGGLWKTTNAGTTFTPVFDSQSSYSIGCVTLDPSAPATVWVGTGENVGGRHVGFGDGVYRSRDGGAGFENMGLKQSAHISKILVDPRDSNRVFVAAQGPLWSPGGERGLYRSTDGGVSWTCVLSGGEWTGVTDVVCDPSNPDVLYAATHQRHRTVWALLNSGAESGIHKSTDGGSTWRLLSNGLPGEAKGKISLGVSPRQNQVVYATVETRGNRGGFYRSEDRGESWTRMSDFVSGGTGPHYYQEIYLDPHRFDVIYHANNTLVRSVDGGRNFESVEGGNKHVDNHVVTFHPTDPDTVLVGCDGGLYRSSDFARTWTFFGNLPVTQFYKIDVDYDWPFYNVVGGTQDNYSQYGPTATGNVQGISNGDWKITIGGDGHDNAIDPENPDLVYCESQQGFLRRYDRRTGESIDIRPQPGEGEEGFRFNWDSPVLISPHSSSRLYFGSKHVHRSDDRGDSWKTISPDLSRGANRWGLPVMGRVWGIDAGFDVNAMSAYGNVTSISESPVVEGLIYAGTDDGLIQVTEDGGQNWRKIEKIYGIPESAFVNDVKADRHDADTVYACLDSHKTGDLKPYLVRSRDRGRTWESLAGDLPDRHLVWRLEQDHVNPNLLFLGTEFGVFVSLDAGKKWLKLSSGMPTIPVRDLAIQKRENDLVAATFGRGIYVLDDYSPLRDLSAENLGKPFHLFPVRKARWYLPSDRLGGRMGFQGDSWFVADNPQYGAVFTVCIRDPRKSLKQLREEKEAALAGEGKDVPLPTWEELQAEKDERLADFFLQISDADKKFVNRMKLPESKGIHRVAWDFRFAPGGTGGIAGLAGPGNYRASIVRIDGGKTETVDEGQPFVVESIVHPALPPQDRAARLALEQSMFRLQGKLAGLNERLEQARLELDAARASVIASAADPAPLLSSLNGVDSALKGLQRKLSGDPEKASRSVEEVPTPGSRLAGALFGSASTMHGATATQQQQFELARREIEGLLPSATDLLDVRMPALKKELDAAGIPWTTGRRIAD